MIRQALTAIAGAALLAAALAPAAGAQGAGGVEGQQPARRAAGAPGARPALDRLAAAVQKQLGLTDEQATQLREATRSFAEQRDRLLVQERATRLELRANVMRGDSADQGRVAQLLDQLVAHQRRRVELVGEEQRELARFLNPVQRAQFLAMQERALRAAQQLRAAREQAARAAGAPGAVPPGVAPGARPLRRPLKQP